MDAADTRIVLHLPGWRRGNPYLTLLGQGLHGAHWTSVFAEYERGLLPLHATLARHGRPAVVHLHWVTPYIQHLYWARSTSAAWLKGALLVFDILWTRLRGTRVVWTWHNLLSHESPDAAREVLGRRLLALSVSRIIFHSESARQRVAQTYGRRVLGKSVVIPHGSYIGVYPEDPARERALRERFELSADDRVVLYFGTLRGYKGITGLLQAFRQTSDAHLRLIIAGKPYTPALRGVLERDAAHDPRVRLYAEHVPDEEVAPLFALASMVALPFQRTLSSGSVLLAMSLGKALLLSGEARVLDVVDNRGAVFADDPRQLTAALQNTTAEDLDRMGRHNLAVTRQLGWDKIGNATAQAYVD